MSFSKCFILFLSFVASANALATPHVARNSIHHRAIAHRAAPPAPLNVPSLPIRKRASGKRCRQRSSSAIAQASTSAAVPATSSPVANVAPVPSISSSSAEEKPATTSQAAPATTTQEQPATTSSKPAAPTTTAQEQPTTTVAPTTTHKPTTTTQAPQTTADSGDLPSFMVGTQTGQGTFYGTGLGACGITNNDADHIAAVSHLLFDNFPGYARINPNNNPVCKRKVKATYQGKSVTVAITDRCVGCAVTDLDFSPSAFNLLADPAIGRISGMTWEWL